MSETNNTIHVHRLDGCRPTPLAHYLKALGILRLVSEQADKNVRGWWREDVFHIATTLDRESLESFFLNDYCPTPMMAPWNGGSGFFPSDNKSGIEPIASSTAKRFEIFRRSIKLGQSVVADLDAKPEKGKQKNGVLADCRLLWRESLRGWIDAAMTLDSHGDPAFPALLGTGGNDGRLDFTSNYMQRLVSLFDVESEDAAAHGESVPQLNAAFWAAPSPVLESCSIGQFFPSSTDGTKVNPWDFVLMLEGAIAFRAGVSRRCNSESLPQAAAPFAVRSSGVGYGSSHTADESVRGEQWMPLWSNPATMKEVQSFFQEGRSLIKKQSAERGTDMARAVSRMGVTRGVAQFERYGYIERNGLANLAVPIGRYTVRHQSNQQLLDEVAPWIDHLRGLAKKGNPPTSSERVHRTCEEALMICTQKPTGNSFLSLLVTLGQAEDQMLKSPRHSAEHNARPIPKLKSRWADLILSTNQTPEVRLAFALAAQSGPLESNQRWQTVRVHWLPLNRYNEFEKREKSLTIGPDQSANQLDLERAMIAVIDRRLLAMSRGAAKGFVPLATSDWRYGAQPEDIEAFLERRVDDARILSIARGLMAIDLTRDQSKPSKIPRRESANNKRPLGGLAMYGLLRLAMPTREKGVSLGKGQDYEIRCNPTLFRRLQSGNLGKAIELAARQLSHAGLRPRFGMAVGSQQVARRLAASMALGVAPPTLTRFAFGLTSPEMDENDRRELAAKLST